MSTSPAKFLWVVEAIGFQANRERGIQFLTDCFHGNGYRAPLALLLLIWINRFFLEDMQETERLLHIAKEKYPNGSLFYFLAGYFYRKKGQLADAINSFQLVHDCSAQLRQLQINSYYELGWCYYLLLEWEKAIECFETFLSENKTPSFRAYCGYQLGVCYEMLDRHDKAVNVFVKVPGWVRKHFTYDQFAARKSKEYASYENGISDLEKKLLRAAILTEGLQYKEALSTLADANEQYELEKETLGEDQQFLEHKANFMYTKGVVLKAMGLHEEATTNFIAVVNMENKIPREIYLVPHSLTEVAEIHVSQNRLSQAATFLHKAKEYSDYDFDKPLLRRIDNSLDKIKKSLNSKKDSKAKRKMTVEKPVDNVQNFDRLSGQQHIHEPSTLGSVPEGTNNLPVTEQQDTNNTQESSQSERDTPSERQSEPLKTEQEMVRPDNQEATLCVLTTVEGSVSTSHVHTDSDGSDYETASEGEDERDVDNASEICTNIGLSSRNDLNINQENNNNSIPGEIQHVLLPHSHSNVERSTDHQPTQSRNLHEILEVQKKMHLDRLDEIVWRMRVPQQGVSIQDRRWYLRVYSKCFVGSEAVNWLVRHSLAETREKAVEIGQQMLDESLLHHVTFSQPFRDGKYYYRFQEDADTPALNMKRIWKYSPRPFGEVFKSLAELIYQILDQYLTPDERHLDLKGLRASKLFRKFTIATAELQRIDLFTLNVEEKLALFLNLYNMMVIHGYAVMGPPTNALSRLRFFGQVKYNIGGEIYSLDDIEHGILRGSLFNPFGANDSRRFHVLTRMEPRIHFALNCGAASCPPMRLWTPENISGALDWAAESFIEEDLDIDIGKKTITMSKILYWYRNDFGTTEGLLNFIAKYVSKDNAEKLEYARQHHFAIKHRPYDWTPIVFRSKE